MADLQRIKNKFDQYLQKRIINTPNKKTQSILNTPISSYINSSNSQIDKYFQQNSESSLIKSEEDTCSYRPKKLIKIKQMEENTCPICLQYIRQQCYLNCNHKFCKECLQIWLKTSNLCPYCRASSVSYRYRQKIIAIQIKQKVNNQQIDYQIDLQCYVCMNAHEGDILLICDSCQGYACHIDCDSILNGVMPQEEQPWFCHYCRAS